MKIIYKCEYDIKTGGINIIKYPVTMSGETFNGHYAYTVKKINSIQTKTISEETLDKFTIFDINAAEKTLHAQMWSLNNDTTIFTTQIINNLKNIYKNINSENYANFLSNENLEKYDSTAAAIKEILRRDFGINSDNIFPDDKMEDPNITNLNPNFIYKHSYNVKNDTFDSIAFINKDEYDDTYVLQEVTGSKKIKIRKGMLEIFAETKKTKTYFMFSRSADITGFQKKLLNELSEHSDKMAKEYERISECINYNAHLAKKLTRHINSKTSNIEIYEMTFKNGKFAIKTHNIRQSSETMCVIENGTKIPYTSFDTIMKRPCKIGEPYENYTYYTYSKTNNMRNFKKAVTDKLEEMSNRITNFEIEGLLNAEKQPEKCIVSNENDEIFYIKDSNISSTYHLYIYRFIRNLNNSAKRIIRITKTAIPYVDKNETSFVIYDDEDYGCCSVSKKCMNVIETEPNGNTLMWSESENEKSFINYMIQKLQTENAEIEKMLKN